jgi:hypothetical protein
MSEELEVIPPTPKPPRFNLKDVKPPSYNETVDTLMSQTGLERWQVEGVMGDCIMQKSTKESQAKIAARWGVAFGEVSACRNMGKVTIDEARASMGTKSIILADRALDSLMDDMNDPEKLAEMKPKDKLSIAKQLTDNAINLENKAVAGQGQTNIDVGTVQILIQNQQARQKEGGNDAMARLLAKGVNKELIDKAANA